MGARSLRMKLQRARLVQYELSSPVSSPPLPTTTYIAYPPIFLSPSNFDAFSSPSPSPSPLPVAGSSPRHELPTAVIVGGGIAGVVALAATATIVSTVAGKLGLSCLLGPLFKLLSCFGGNLFGPCSQRLDSLRDTLKKWNPARRRGRSNEAADNNEGSADGDGDMLYEILGGSPTKASKDLESTAAAAHSLTTSPLQNVVKGHVEQLQTSAHAYLVTTVSDFAESTESELRRKKEMMMQPLDQSIKKAQSYAGSFFSDVEDNVSDSLRYLDLSSDVVGGLKGNASYVKASVFNEVIEVGAEKTSKGHTMASEKLQGHVLLLEEEAVLHRKRGRPLLTSSNGGTDELEEEKLEQTVLLNGGGKRSGDAYTELQVLEESTAGASASHKQETRGAASDATTHHMALVPTNTGGTATNTIPKAAAGTMVPVPRKALAPLQGKTMTSSVKGKWARDDVTKARERKRKRPTNNLGHVSFSCEMSAHRLRFFTSCRSGGTYGSPPASPDHSSSGSSSNNNKKIINSNHNNNNNNNNSNYNHYQDDDSIIKVVYPTSSAQRAHNYQLYVPLYNAPSHYNIMNQQQYHPSPSILVQHNTSSAPAPFTHHIAPLSAAPFEVMDNKSPSHGPLKPSEIHDYGDPFDGVL